MKAKHLTRAKEDFAENYEIPYGTVTVGRNAFFGRQNITSVTVCDSVTFIYGSAFRNCKNLAFINIGKNVKFIGERAFEETGAEKIILPDGLEFIGGRAFYRCKNLVSVTVPESVYEIGEQAFAHCADGLTVIYKGTKDEWKSLYKCGDNENFSVECSDGRI